VWKNVFFEIQQKNESLDRKALTNKRLGFHPKNSPLVGRKHFMFSLECCRKARLTGCRIRIRMPGAAQGE
jgi:hypothetical protein